MPSRLGSLHLENSHPAARPSSKITAMLVNTAFNLLKRRKSRQFLREFRRSHQHQMRFRDITLGRASFPLKVIYHFYFEFATIHFVYASTLQQQAGNATKLVALPAFALSRRVQHSFDGNSISFTWVI